MSALSREEEKPWTHHKIISFLRRRRLAASISSLVKGKKFAWRARRTSTLEATGSPATSKGSSLNLISCMGWCVALFSTYVKAWSSDWDVDWLFSFYPKSCSNNSKAIHLQFVTTSPSNVSHKPVKITRPGFRDNRMITDDSLVTFPVMCCDAKQYWRRSAISIVRTRVAEMESDSMLQ